jgi:anaerobic selenocysteine-containing dehydrogenase
MAAGLTGCKNEAIWRQEATGQYGGMSNKAFPYVNQPDGTTDGIPVYYATTCQMCPAGCGLFVRTLGGRANKIEGNPLHPVNLGKTCLRGQLALQHMYNPDRLMYPMHRPDRASSMNRLDWSAALSSTAARLTAARGKVAILVDGDTIARSPTKLTVLQEMSAKLGARLVEYSLFEDRPWREASSAIYGRNQVPAYRLDNADLIVSFGGNFLEAWPSPVYYGRLFGEFRQGPRRNSQSGHGHFIYVGPRLSMTGAKADVWLPCRRGTEGLVAQGVLHELGGSGVPAEAAAAAAGLEAAQIVDIADKIRSAGSRAVAIGGEGLYSSANITEAFTAVDGINVQTNSQCIEFGESEIAVDKIRGGFRELLRLTDDMSAGKVGALITVGSVNPAFALPQSAGWQKAFARTPFVLSLCSFLDDTSANSDVALACRSFLEEWSDTNPLVSPGGSKITSVGQPVIDPQFITKRHDIDDNNEPIPMMDTRELVDVLLEIESRLTGAPGSGSGMGSVRKTWASVGAASLTVEDATTDPLWTSVVSQGGRWAFVKPTAARHKAPQIMASPAPAVRQGQFSLLLFQQLYYGDGRNANLGWAQEMPDPITSVVWNSWVEINRDVAHVLGIRTGDIVELVSEFGSIHVAALPLPGLHPETLAMPIGQGHTTYGRNGSGVGLNPLSILAPIMDDQTGSLAYAATTVGLRQVSSAVAGYHADLKTLVLVQDRPHGVEPPALKDLIHETAAEWKRKKGTNPTPKTYRSKPVI